MAFPDRLDAPARTVITSEGGAGASRTTHVVRHADGRLRRLVPEELEVLTGFARGFTDIAGITPAKRGFLMGNALVTGLVSLRTRGIGFIMITLAFNQMFYFLAVSLKQYGGDDGLPLNERSALAPLPALAFLTMALKRTVSPAWYKGLSVTVKTSGNTAALSS